MPFLWCHMDEQSTRHLIFMILQQKCGTDIFRRFKFAQKNNNNKVRNLRFSCYDSHRKYSNVYELSYAQRGYKRIYLLMVDRFDKQQRIDEVCWLLFDHSKHTPQRYPNNHKMFERIFRSSLNQVPSKMFVFSKFWWFKLKSSWAQLVRSKIEHDPAKIWLPLPFIVYINVYRPSFIGQFHPHHKWRFANLYILYVYD